MAAQDPPVPFPAEGLSPRPPFQPLLPGPLDGPIELPQTAVVRWATIVLVVAAKFGVEDGLLLVHVVVSVSAAPFRNGRKRPSEAPAGRPTRRNTRYRSARYGFDRARLAPAGLL